MANDGVFARIPRVEIHPFDSSTARKIAALRRFVTGLRFSAITFMPKKQKGQLAFCFFGGGGENRTPVRKPLNQTFYERIRWFNIPSPDLPPAGYRLK